MVVEFQVHARVEVVIKRPNAARPTVHHVLTTDLNLAFLEQIGHQGLIRRMDFNIENRTQECNKVISNKR